MADITNNPFIDKTASAASRYPSLDTDRSSSPHVSAQYTSWLQSPVSSSSGPYISNGAPSPMANNPVGYSGVQPVYQQPQTPYAQQWSAPQPAYGMQPSQYSDQGTQGLAPSGSYGQQFVAQSTGYPQHQNYAGMPQQGYGGYQSQFGHGQQQQQQQQQTPAYGGNSYLAQFDPYSNNITSPAGQAPPLSTNPSFSSGSANSHSPHPRTFISTHKAELEQWDAPTWKQALNTFDTLKGAWQQRKEAAEARVRALGGVPGGASGFFGAPPAYGSGYGGYGYGQQQANQQEIDQLNAVSCF